MKMQWTAGGVAYQTRDSNSNTLNEICEHM